LIDGCVGTIRGGGEGEGGEGDESEVADAGFHGGSPFGLCGRLLRRSEVGRAVWSTFALEKREYREGEVELDDHFRDMCALTRRGSGRNGCSGSGGSMRGTGEGGESEVADAGFHGGSSFGMGRDDHFH
jgi:hypothetical protein